MSSEHAPSEQEIAKQKAETYQALSSFHETRAAARNAGDTSLFGGYDDDQDANMAEYWECKDGAVSFPVPMDPAAGLKKGAISKPYRSNVQIQMNINRSSTTGSLQRQGLRLVETMQFQDDEDNLLPPFVRSIPMDANVDVDSADGSYSLDVTISGDEHLPLLPASMSAGLNPVCIKFLVEHTIAISDFERCRCFFIYGDADRDGGAKEERDFEDEDDRGDEDFDEDDSSDRINRNYRLLGVVFADESKKLPANTVPPKPAGISSLLNKEQPATSESPLDLLRLDATEIIEMSDQDKMDALYKAIGKHNERVMANSDGTNQSKEGNVASMTRYTPTMYNICSGVYLGDTFIREPLKSIGKSQSKGFGNLKSRRSDEEDKHDAFARWSLGVQKTSIQFYWDYSANVIQACQYGKSLGAVNKLKCNAMSRSVGTVVVDEGRVTKPRQERRTIWYLDGAYVAGLIGSSYFRVSSLSCACYYLCVALIISSVLHSKIKGTAIHVLF